MFSPGKTSITIGEEIDNETDCESRTVPSMYLYHDCIPQKKKKKMTRHFIIHGVYRL